jgi:pyruvate formate lyase activating enzyme
MAAREAARKHLKHVYLGNVSLTDGSDTCCGACGAKLVGRRVYDVEPVGVGDDGSCLACGKPGPIVVKPAWEGKG